MNLWRKVVKAMPTTQKTSVLDVCMYPKAPPWKSVKDPGFTGSPSPTEQSPVSVDFVQDLFPMIHLLPACTTHLVFFHCHPRTLCFVHMELLRVSPYIVSFHAH